MIPQKATANSSNKTFLKSNFDFHLLDEDDQLWYFFLKTNLVFNVRPLRRSTEIRLRMKERKRKIKSATFFYYML